jgi:hypothetical protein
MIITDRVQGVLELNHDADGGKDQGADPDDGRDRTFARPVWWWLVHPGIGPWRGAPAFPALRSAAKPALGFP